MHLHVACVRTKGTGEGGRGFSPLPPSPFPPPPHPPYKRSPYFIACMCIIYYYYNNMLGVLQMGKSLQNHVLIKPYTLNW